MNVLHKMDQQPKRHARADVLEDRLSFRLALQNENAGWDGVNDICLGGTDGIIAVLRFLEWDVGVMRDRVIGIGGLESEHFFCLVRPAFNSVGPDGGGGESFVSEQFVNVL